MIRQSFRKAVRRLCLAAVWGVIAVAPSEAQEDQVRLTAIDKIAEWLNPAASFSQDANGSLRMSCRPGEALFNAPIGTMKLSNAPLLLFSAAPEFTFSAKLEGPIETFWDAMQLMLWSDSDHWAKLYLERSHEQKPIVGSIVTNGTSDDCNSIVLAEPRVWLQVSRIEDCIFFYYSTDGDEWHFVRGFKLPAGREFRLGFSCESTNGDKGTSGRFSEIRYSETRVADMFRGK